MNIQPGAGQNIQRTIGIPERPAGPVKGIGDAESAVPVQPAVIQGERAGHHIALDAQPRVSYRRAGAREAGALCQGIVFTGEYELAAGGTVEGSRVGSSAIQLQHPARYTDGT